MLSAAVVIGTIRVKALNGSFLGVFVAFYCPLRTYVGNSRAKTLLLVQKWVSLVNKELIFPVFSIKFVKFGFKLEKNNEKYILGIFQLLPLFQI